MYFMLIIIEINVHIISLIIEFAMQNNTNNFSTSFN